MKKCVFSVFCVAVLFLCGCGQQPASTASAPDSNVASGYGFSSDTASSDGDSNEQLPTFLPSEDTFPDYNGLIVERIYNQGSIQTGYHFTVLLTCLNIDTGVSHPVSTFDFDVAEKGTQDGYIMPASASIVGQVANRSLFSKHYDKIALGKYSLDTNMISAGWLDSNGEFFDVTNYLGLETEYGIGFNAIGFCDDYFVYCEYKTTTSRDFFYVPMSDLTQENIIDNFADKNLYMQSCGDFYADPYNLTWVGQNYAISDVNASAKSQKTILIGDKTQGLEFKLQNFGCKSGICSPDETRLAYLTWTDESNDIFEIDIADVKDFTMVQTVAVTDGTEYLFSTWTGDDGTIVPALGTGSGIYNEGLRCCYLIDWE